MIAQWIAALEGALEALLQLLLQVMYLLWLAIGCVVLLALMCLPLIVGCCMYLDRKQAQAKRSAPCDPRVADTLAETRGFFKGLTAALVALSVKGRAPGLSEHASPFGQTEARAERTLERPPDKTASARECGAAPPPRAPEPSAARVG